jgi:hypothetical protein
MVINSPRLRPSRLAFFWYLNWASHLKYTKEAVCMMDFPLFAQRSLGLTGNASQAKPSLPAETQ